VLSYSTAEWSTAALFRIGESYESFAKGLRDYPMPKGLAKDQQEAYSEQLDTFALAFEEEAIGAYKSGYAKAVELGIYNTYTKKIRAALGRLSPQEFPPIAEIGTETRAAGGSGNARAVRSLKR
jgi:cellulose synthase operon protein C